MQTLRELAGLVTRYKYTIGSEAEFQEGLDRVLTLNGIEHAREHDLGGIFGRIDFYIPGPAIGIELKLKASPSEVMRQLHRYAQCPGIGALLLVTVRSRTAFTPGEINRKPVMTASVWQGQI